MAKLVYVGKNKCDIKWLAEAAEFVQEKFQENGHEFILIPCKDVDKVISEAFETGDLHFGTCLTDCTDVVSFATAMAGAICCYSMTSKDKGKGKSSVVLARTILNMVKEVNKLNGKR